MGARHDVRVITTQVVSSDSSSVFLELMSEIVHYFEVDRVSPFGWKCGMRYYKVVWAIKWYSIDDPVFAAFAADYVHEVLQSTATHVQVQWANTVEPGNHVFPERYAKP
jgi:hypothetical protein